MRRILFYINTIVAGVRVFRRGARAGIIGVRITAVAVLIIVCGGAIYAQSVDSLVNEALRNNRQLKGLEQRVRAASYKSETVGYLPAPTLGIEFQQVPFSDPNPFNQALSQNLSFSQMFMIGGKLSSMAEAEKQNVPIAQSDYDIAKQKLIAEVKEEYYKIWMDEHHAELREDNINIIKDLLSRAENSYRVNKANYSEVLLLRAELSSYQTDYDVLNNEAMSEIYKMNNLLGRDIGSTDIKVRHGWKIDTLAQSPKELEDILLNNNPSIKKMSSMIKMSELEVYANNKELIPDIMVQGMVMRMPRGMILTTKSDPMMMSGLGETEYMYSVMASITLPFMPWSSGRITSKEEELQADISGLSMDRKNMQEEMVAQLNALLKKLESKREQAELYQNEVIPLYRSAFEAQLGEYRNSRLSINSLIETMRSILAKEEALAEVKMDYEMTLADIYMMAGIR
jgi:outer membrane protein, heavy metal efflux system